VHDLDRVVCVFLALEFDKAVALMLIGDFISGDMDVDDRSALGEQFPEEALVDFGVNVAGIDCCLLVAFVEGGYHCHCSYNIGLCLIIKQYYQSHAKVIVGG
jgi:hypothetical protein